MLTSFKFKVRIKSNIKLEINLTLGGNMTKGSYKSVLQEHQFLKMILANVISRFGDSLDMIAFSWMVYAITGSAIWIAVIFGCNSLPSIFLQPFAGVYVERMSKKRVMVLCDIGRGIAVIVTAMMYIMGILTPWSLIVITVVNSSLESLRIPAGIAVTPHILNKDKYEHGMALSSSMSRVAEVIGIVSAGSIVGLLGVEYAMFIDAATFFISALMIAMIRYHEKVDRTSTLDKKQFFFELKAGYSYLRKKRVVYYICLFGSLIGFIMIPLNHFNVIYIQDILSLGPEGLSVFAVAVIGGMAIGSFLTPRVKEKWTGRHMLSMSGILLGLSLFLLIGITVITKVFWVYMMLALTMVILGISAGIINVIVNVTFMSHVESEYLSRVGSLFNALAMSITPIGAVIFGGLAAFLTIEKIFILTGILSIVLFSCVYLIKAFKAL